MDDKIFGIKHYSETIDSQCNPEILNDPNGLVIWYHNPNNARVRVRLYYQGEIGGFYDNFIERDNINLITKDGFDAYFGHCYVLDITPEECDKILRGDTTHFQIDMRIQIEEEINGIFKPERSTHHVFMNVTYSAPIFTDFMISERNTNALAITNGKFFLQNVSDIYVRVPEQWKMKTSNYATPKGYHIGTGDGMTDQRYAPYVETGPVAEIFYGIKCSRDLHFIVSAEDSRGQFTTVEKVFYPHPYEQPDIFGTVERLNRFENRTTLKIKGNFTVIVYENLRKNSITSVKYRYGETIETMTGWLSIPYTFDMNTGEFICNDTLLDLDNTKSFIFEIAVEDELYFSGNVKKLYLDVGKPILFIGNDRKIGINKVPNSQREGLDLNPDDNIFNLMHPIGYVYISMVNINPATFFSGTWEQLEDVFLLACGKIHTIGEVGGEERHKLIKTELPAERLNVLDGSYLPREVRVASMANDGADWPSLKLGDNSGQNRGYLVTENMGNGEAHNNMPPYIAVYMWRRIG